MLELLNRFWKEEEGQDLVEYALILVLIALIAVATFPAVGQEIEKVFSKVLVQLKRTS